MSDAVTRAREFLEGQVAIVEYHDAQRTISGILRQLGESMALLAELANEVERLQERLDAVMAIHSDRNGDCAECEMGTGQGVTWPCYTYNAAQGMES